MLKLLAMSGLIATLACAAHAADSAPPAEKPKMKIEPTFIELKEFTVAGIAVFDTPLSGQFPKLWGSFPATVNDAPGLEMGHYAYGVELFPPNFERDKKFTYIASCAVSDSRKVPLHLVTRTLPASQYAAFAVPGGLKGLGDTFGYIYREWLPASNYEVAFPFDMERYDVSKVEHGGEMTIEILVPVKEKKQG
jgi:predicted transcriptional regulator YdeE